MTRVAQSGRETLPLRIAKLSISRTVLTALIIIVTVICFPLLQVCVFNAEEKQAAPLSPLDCKRKGKRSTGKMQELPTQSEQGTSRHTNTQNRHEDEVPQNPQKQRQTGDVAVDQSVDDEPAVITVEVAPEQRFHKIGKKEGSKGKAPRQEEIKNDTYQYKPNVDEPQEKTADESNREVLPDNLDLVAAVRWQKIFAISTPKTRYAACIPPKNGCTYHIALLHRINGVKDYEVVPVIHDIEKKRALDMERFSQEEARKWLEDEHIPKYLVVRNPMMRTLSAYLDKIARMLRVEERTVEHFEEWVMQEFPKGRTSAKKRVKMDPHWLPQTQYCGVKSKLHTRFRIFRFEEPEELIDYIYEFVPKEFLDDGWRKPDNVSLREFMLGPRKRTGSTSSKFPKYFRSLDVFDHLARELSDDIETFGYQKEVAELRKQTVDSRRAESLQN